MSGKGKLTKSKRGYNVVGDTDDVELEDQRLMLPSTASSDNVVFDSSNSVADPFPSQLSHPAEFKTDFVSEYVNIEVFKQKSLEMKPGDSAAVSSILLLESQIKLIEKMEHLLGQAIQQKAEHSNRYRRFGGYFAGASIVGGLVGYIWNSTRLAAADAYVQQLRGVVSQLTNTLISNVNCTNFLTYPSYDVHGSYHNETDPSECQNSYGAKDCAQYVLDFCQTCISTCTGLIDGSNQLQEANKVSSHHLLVTILTAAGCGIAMLLGYKAYKTKLTDKTAKDILGAEAEQLNNLLIELNMKNNDLRHGVSIDEKAMAFQLELSKAKVDSQKKCLKLLNSTLNLYSLGIFKPINDIAVKAKEPDLEKIFQI